jgi:acyl-coenzyme A thioesterase PaaI-like protein
MMENLKNLEDNDMCFACGKENENGLQLDFSFSKQEKRIQTTFLPSDTYQGWKGVLHGGIIATLVDESMAKLAQRLGYRALTASLDIRFKEVAKTSDSLHVSAEIVKYTKKLLYAKALATRIDGGVIAEAQARLMIL